MRYLLSSSRSNLVSKFNIFDSYVMQNSSSFSFGTCTWQHSQLYHRALSAFFECLNKWNWHWLYEFYSVGVCWIRLLHSSSHLCGSSACCFIKIILFGWTFDRFITSFFEFEFEWFVCVSERCWAFSFFCWFFGVKLVSGDRKRDVLYK